jgi:tRNA (guanosine-2'-O-)-methyltransferase
MKLTQEQELALNKELITFLQDFLTEERRKKFVQNLFLRTRHLTIVLEDIYQPHNASAVLRSCDCFGIQDVHIIENRNKYEVNPDVALGASKWLTMTHYNTTSDNTAGCLTSLKKQGYRLVATSPHINDFTPENLPLESKTALLFGTELAGLSETALQMADDFIKIPMFGFTESLNISVSAAIFLQTLTARLRHAKTPWQLNECEQIDVHLQWLKNSIKKSDLLIEEFIRKKHPEFLHK